jgi:uncharacterized cupin superfamily protein
MPKLDLDRIDRGRAPAEWGDVSWLPLGAAGGLTQYGVALETLGPGARSSDRHWHEREDEFVYVVSGTVTLVEDSGETGLGPGAAAAFPAGHPVGHCLENRGSVAVVYLIAGTWAAADRVHYTTRDRIRIRDAGGERLIRRDGTPLAEGNAE